MSAYGGMDATTAKMKAKIGIALNAPSFNYIKLDIAALNEL